MLEQTHREMAIAEAKKLKALKCVVWDLDNTVWEGVLLEGDTLKLRPQVVHIIKTLDERGILNAIAQRLHMQHTNRCIGSVVAWYVRGVPVQISPPATIGVGCCAAWRPSMRGGTQHACRRS